MHNSGEKTSALQKTSMLIDFDKSFCVERLCGVDEAGRGPLAGPVSVCACVMPTEIPIIGINDSKKLSESMREKLFEKIVAVADYCVVLIDRVTIDEINILEATKLGMKRAIEGLSVRPSHAIIDAVKGLNIDVPYSPVIKADEKSYCTAAASIIAKVTRDRLMRELDRQYPQYGFAANKGYGTAFHIAAIKSYGACGEHRKTFVKNFICDEKV